MCASLRWLVSAAEIGSYPLRSRYPVAYSKVMVEIRQTDAYARWFRRLRDRQDRVRIDSRIRRLSLGNPGAGRPVGEGVSEIRIDYGPGYQVYFVQRGEALGVLLAGGDKDSQETETYEGRWSWREDSRSLSEKQCSKRYASLVECKDAIYSTTKSRLL